jgi:hypothetical protein
MSWGRRGGDLDDDNLGKAAAALSNRDNWRGLSEDQKDALEAEINNNLTAEQKRALGDR